MAAPCVIVAFGRTQVGKSTTLGYLRKEGQPTPITGNGDGESVTQHAALFDTPIGLALDTPGIDDTKRRFTDDEAGRRVAIGVASSRARTAKFLVFESLGSDSMQLRGTLESLSRAFGANACQAALVLATKADMLPNQARLQRRMEAIREVVSRHGLKGIVSWQNEGLDETGCAAQLDSLRQALDSFDGVPVAALEDLRDRQSARAKQMCDAHPIQTRTVEVNVNEQYTEPREVQEPYEEPYVEQEAYMESYEAPETYDVKETHTLAVVQTPNDLARFFGRTKVVNKPVTVTTQKVRMVTKQRKAWRDVTKYRTAYRKVKHYDVKTRMVKKPQVVKYRLPLDRFMADALAEIVEEIRLSLR